MARPRSLWTPPVSFEMTNPRNTPNGESGLNTGASSAGENYNAGVDAAQLTDQKLAELLKQIFAANQTARIKHFA